MEISLNTLTDNNLSQKGGNEGISNDRGIKPGCSACRGCNSSGQNVVNFRSRNINGNMMGANYLSGPDTNIYRNNTGNNGYSTQKKKINFNDWPRVENNTLVFRDSNHFDAYESYLENVIIITPQSPTAGISQGINGILQAIEARLGFTSLRNVAEAEFQRLNEIGWQRLEDIPDRHFIKSVITRSFLNPNQDVKVGNIIFHYTDQYHPSNIPDSDQYETVMLNQSSGKAIKIYGQPGGAPGGGGDPGINPANIPLDPNPISFRRQPIPNVPVNGGGRTLGGNMVNTNFQGSGGTGGRIPWFGPQPNEILNVPTVGNSGAGGLIPLGGAGSLETGGNSFFSKRDLHGAEIPYPGGDVFTTKRDLNQGQLPIVGGDTATSTTGGRHSTIKTTSSTCGMKMNFISAGTCAQPNLIQLTYLSIYPDFKYITPIGGALFELDWGDGTPIESHAVHSDGSSVDPIFHNYKANGTYVIKVTGFAQGPPLLKGTLPCNLVQYYVTVPASCFAGSHNSKDAFTKRADGYRAIKCHAEVEQSLNRRSMGGTTRTWASTEAYSWEHNIWGIWSWKAYNKFRLIAVKYSIDWLDPTNCKGMYNDTMYSSLWGDDTVEVRQTDSDIGYMAGGRAWLQMTSHHEMWTDDSWPPVYLDMVLYPC